MKLRQGDRGLKDGRMGLLKKREREGRGTKEMRGKTLIDEDGDKNSVHKIPISQKTTY